MISFHVYCFTQGACSNSKNGMNSEACILLQGSNLYVIYKIPSPVKQCCLKVIEIALEGELMSFELAKGFSYRFNFL